MGIIKTILDIRRRGDTPPDGIYIATEEGYLISEEDNESNLITEE